MWRRWCFLLLFWLLRLLGLWSSLRRLLGQVVLKRFALFKRGLVTLDLETLPTGLNPNLSPEFLGAFHRNCTPFIVLGNRNEVFDQCRVFRMGLERGRRNLDQQPAPKTSAIKSNIAVLWIVLMEDLNAIAQRDLGRQDGPTRSVLNDALGFVALCRRRNLLVAGRRVYADTVFNLRGGRTGGRCLRLASTGIPALSTRLRTLSIQHLCLRKLGLWCVRIVHRQAPCDRSVGRMLD